jgi:hypothetical protein
MSGVVAIEFRLFGFFFRQLLPSIASVNRFLPSIAGFRNRLRRLTEEGDYGSRRLTEEGDYESAQGDD